MRRAGQVAAGELHLPTTSSERAETSTTAIHAMRATEREQVRPVSSQLGRRHSQGRVPPWHMPHSRELRTRVGRRSACFSAPVAEAQTMASPNP